MALINVQLTAYCFVFFSLFVFFFFPPADGWKLFFGTDRLEGSGVKFKDIAYSVLRSGFLFNFSSVTSW